jgi:AraC-like DNA-binding protein
MPLPKLVRWRATALPGRRILGIRGFQIPPTPRRCRLMLPDGVVKLMIGFGEPVAVVDVVEPDGALVAVSTLNPLRATACAGIHSGGLQGITVSMTPAAAYRLFGTALDELGGRPVSLLDLWGRRADAIADQLAELPGWEARFRLVEERLARRWARGRPVAPEVDAAWQLLRTSGGTVAVKELAAATGWSVRRLQRRFAQQVGLPPKAVAGVLRLQRALRRREDGVPWAEAAADAGYYDQPHFNRAFTAMVGWTPEEFRAARELAVPGDVRDFVAGDVTSVLVPDR